MGLRNFADSTPYACCIPSAAERWKAAENTENTETPLQRAVTLWPWKAGNPAEALGPSGDRFDEAQLVAANSHLGVLGVLRGVAFNAPTTLWPRKARNSPF